MLPQIIKKYLMIVTFCLLFCLLFFFDLSSITGEEIPNIKNDIERAYFVKGLINLREEQYEDAHRNFNKALEINANYKPAITGKIETFFKENDLRKAENFANEAINRFPDYGDFYYHLGKILIKRNRYERAIEAFNKALESYVEVHPFDILLNRADAKQNLDMLEEALLDYNEAIMMNNNKSIVYHVRGVVHYKLKQYEKAIADFERSIEIVKQDETHNTVNSNTYYNLGMSYLRIEDRISACQNFHKGCQSGNQNACRMVIIRCSQQ